MKVPGICKKAVILGTVAALLALTGACGGSSVGLSPAVKRLQAQQYAFDHAHPGLVTCEADVEVLVTESVIAMQEQDQAITPAQAAVRYPGSAAAAAYPYFYGALLADVARHGTPDDVTAYAVVQGNTYLLQDHCLAALSAIHGHPVGSPGSGPAPDTAGCPGSAQLLAAWNAAPPGARHSWTDLVPTGFEDTTCWHQWVVTNPVMNANGTVIFYKHNGQLDLLPATELSKFNSAICNTADTPAEWSSPIDGPATCS